jgi:hypothetical protein
MALPKLDVPTYEIELPISKRKVKYRPFLVKEQKNLLMALESNEASTIQQNVFDILNNCTITEGIDIDKLPIIDVEYYFINLRAKSVGEVIESRYKCNNEVDEVVCGNVMEKDINLLEIKVQSSGEISPEIQLNDKLTIKLKYPEFSIIKDSLRYDNINEVTFNMIANSIEYIYDGEQFFYAHESTPEELVEFVESMNQSQFEKVEEFFSSIPQMKKTLEITCGKCRYEHKIEMEGLESFFG